MHISRAGSTPSCFVECMYKWSVWFRCCYCFSLGLSGLGTDLERYLSVSKMWKWTQWQWWSPKMRGWGGADNSKMLVVYLPEVEPHWLLSSGLWPCISALLLPVLTRCYCLWTCSEQVDCQNCWPQTPLIAWNASPEPWAQRLQPPIVTTIPAAAVAAKMKLAQGPVCGTEIICSSQVTVQTPSCPLDRYSTCYFSISPDS